MNIPDSIDKQLIRLLGRDARQNSETLAKQLNISSATVRRKLRKFIQSGTLHIIGVVDPTKFDLPLTAVIALDVVYEQLKSVAETLVNRPEMIFVSSTTGRFDIIAVGQFASTDSLSGFLTDQLAPMDGVKNILSFLARSGNWTRNRRKLHSLEGLTESLILL